MGRGNLSCICITTHWIDENFFLEKWIIELTLYNHSHTSVYIHWVVSDCCNFFNIREKILSMTFDNAINNSKVVGYLKKIMQTMFDDFFFLMLDLFVIFCIFVFKMD